MNLYSIIVWSLHLGQGTSSTTLLNPGPQHRSGHNQKCLMDTCRLKKEAKSSTGKISELHTQRRQLHSSNLEGLLCQVTCWWFEGQREELNTAPALRKASQVQKEAGSNIMLARFNALCCVPGLCSELSKSPLGNPCSSGQKGT